MKRGQLTLFLIIGLMLLGITAVAIYISQISVNEGPQKIDSDPLVFFVNDCVKKTLEEAIKMNSIKGGYYSVPENSVQYSFLRVPYYWNKGNVSVPSVFILEKELSAYVEENSNFCINNFKSFENQSYSFKYGKILSSVSINNKTVSVSVNQPIQISRAGNSVKINKFSAEVNYNYGEIHSFVKEILEEQKADPEYIPVSFISESCQQKGCFFETIAVDSQTTIISIIMNEDADNEFVYSFAAKYNWSESNEE
jgi:hypothetical protein